MFWGIFLVTVTGITLCGLFLLASRLTGFLSVSPELPPAVSLLMVVRNQAPAIEGLIRNILAYHHRPLTFFELVVVDDRSDDETPEILRRLNRRHPFILIRMDRFPGERAQETGLRYCRGDTVYCFDLTGQVNPRLFARLVGRLLKGRHGSPVDEGCSITLVKKRIV